MEWISVKDRLPEIASAVVAIKTNGRIEILSYHSGFDVGKRDFWYWGFGKWHKQTEKVTHWILLPEKPN